MPLGKKRAVPILGGACTRVVQTSVVGIMNGEEGLEDRVLTSVVVPAFPDASDAFSVTIKCHSFVTH